jgi:hypothetical protein
MNQFQPVARQRLDIYRPIHKALRSFICDTMLRVGRLDCADAQETSQVLAQARAMATFYIGHMRHEDEFVHPAMEAHGPGSADAIEVEHGHHEAACQRIVALSTSAGQAHGAEREALVHQLYQHIALFLGETLEHMHVEETDHNAVLWKHYSDAQILAMDHAIVASLGDEEKGLGMRWMLPALSPSERVQLLRGMQGAVPPEVFAGMCAFFETLLAPADWRKLAAALEIDERLAA